MKLVIEINMDGAAFDLEPREEVSRILREMLRIQLSAWDVQNPRTGEEHLLHDINGNTVGSAHVVED